MCTQISKTEKIKNQNLEVQNTGKPNRDFDEKQILISEAEDHCYLAKSALFKSIQRHSTLFPVYSFSLVFFFLFSVR